MAGSLSGLDRRREAGLRIRCFLFSGVLLALSAPAWGSDLIRCTAVGNADVVLSLNDGRRLGRMVSCIQGEFIADMTPCAPNGGFGLSAPTGSASLVRIVNRWQDYGDHFGGITGFVENSSRIHFDGGFFSPEDSTNSTHWSDQWSFTADRLTGEAKLTRDGKADVTYRCEKANKRF